MTDKNKIDTDLASAGEALKRAAHPYATGHLQGRAGPEAHDRP